MKKIREKTKYNSLFKRVFIPMCMLVGLIVCFLIGIIFYYNILGQLNDNSRNLFNQQVENRSSYLENLMLSKWSDIKNDVIDIQTQANEIIKKKNISIQQLTTNSSLSQQVLNEISHPVISMMRNHETTGSFVFFTEGGFGNTTAATTPGFYVTDNDPDGDYEETNADLLIERCPVNMIDQLDIPMSSHWKPTFEFSETEIKDYNRVLENFKLVVEDEDYTIEDVASWMKPYSIAGSDRYCISYILPLIYNNQIYGAVGIDISFSYLQKILPYNELNQDAKGCFVLALKGADQEYIPLFLNGPKFSEDIKPFNSMRITGKAEKYINETIYCSYDKLDLYNSNTPNEDQQWIVMGIIEKGDLYSFTDHLQGVFLIVFSIVVLLGTLLSYALSRYISKPIVDLAGYIEGTSGADSRVNLKRTHIIEIDQLIEAIEKMGNDVMTSATRFTNIIKLANTNLAGFEIDYENNELFITEGFFDIFLLYDVDTRHMSIEEFNSLFKSFNDCCIGTQSNGEYLYHIKRDEKETYLRLRFNGDDIKYVGLIEEVTDMIKEKQVIEHERDHDVLTGLMNRRAFQRVMRRLFTIDTQKLKVAALVMMDLDNLKEVNDKYGHDAGDCYIKEAAHVFETSMPEGTIVSRTSGDEFYLFLYGFDSKKEIEKIIDGLKTAIGKSVAKLPNEREVKLYVSGGVTWYPEDSTSFDELQRFSDYAMYSVKRSIKGKIESFNLSDYESNTFLMKKRSDYHQMIEHKQYIYFFQPIVDARSGQIFGYEALMRSMHPSFKDPKEILALAKLEGELGRIEELTWQGAMATYNEFYQSNVVSQDAKLFVNSISNQLIPTEGVYELERRTPDILKCIVLEVTEEEENNENAFLEKQSHLERWQGQIALDDYGSGYNSERNLLLVNPDYVKVDIDIIRDIDVDIDKQKIVENIVSYCHERNKRVVAEGVETIAELKTVLRLGADYIQGYIFARPSEIPPDIDQDSKKALLEMNK